MVEWGFLTNHARVLVCIAQDPGARLRDIAAALNITERSAYTIVTDLAAAGYVVKTKDGRRNRYRIRRDLPWRESVGRKRTIGEVLDVLTKASVRADAHPSQMRRRSSYSPARRGGAGRPARYCCVVSPR